MLDRKFIDETVRAHNEYRARHQAPPLSHNEDLSVEAQKWADHLVRTNTFQHSRCSYKGEPVGENIAMKWSTRPDAYTGQEVTDQWYSEVKMYQFGGEPRTQSAGHFSQVVWRNSKQIGIGKAPTPDGKIIVVANYRPAGNMYGEYSKNVLPPRDGKIVVPDTTPKPASSGFRSDRPDVAPSGGTSPFSSRFEGMRRDFFEDSPGARSTTTSTTRGESKSVRTYTVTEGSGANKVTKTIVEETIIKPDGSKVVNRKETTSTGNSGAGALEDNGRFERLFIRDAPQDTTGLRGNNSTGDQGHKSEKMSDFLDNCVKAHNTYRNKHGVSPLKLSRELTTHAQNWAEHLAKTNSFQHSECMLKGERLGENLASKWSSGGGDYTGQEVADQWYSEISKHNFASERSMESGHFTQMVWKESKEIGIGKVKAAGGRVVVVANYRPAGNVIGRYRDNVFPPKK